MRDTPRRVQGTAVRHRVHNRPQAGQPCPTTSREASDSWSDGRAAAASGMISVVERRGGGTFGYRPAVDGLRALAVGAVIVYHFGYGWARGGFLGVDTFFVLSGYLITSLLLVEFRGQGTVRLRAFWARRARRLLPALLLMLAVVTIWAGLTRPADQLGVIRGDGLATLFYGANWRFIASGQTYFALGVAALAVPSRVVARDRGAVLPRVAAHHARVPAPRAAAGRAVLATVCVLGSLGSIVAMAALYQPSDPSRAYYGTETRAYALLIGALLAIVLQRWATIAPSERRRGTGYAALAGVGVLAAVACFAAFALIPDTDGAMYRGGFALFAVAVALLIAAAVSPGPSPVRALLAFGPLVWVGRISYGLYLWHWPVQLAFDTRTRRRRRRVAGSPAPRGDLHDRDDLLLRVELPIRRGVLGRRMRRVLAPAAVVGVATVVVATTAAAVPPPAYLNNAGAQGLDRTLARVSAAKPRAALPVPTTVAPSTAPPTGPPSAGAIAAAAPPTPPVTHPPPRRILGVGDSLLSSLLPGLTPAARGAGDRPRLRRHSGLRRVHRRAARARRLAPQLGGALRELDDQVAGLRGPAVPARRGPLAEQLGDCRPDRERAAVHHGLARGHRHDDAADRRRGRALHVDRRGVSCSSRSRRRCRRSSTGHRRRKRPSACSS